MDLARACYSPKQLSMPLIASLNLPIIHWSLRKNEVLEQIHLFQIEFCAKQQLYINKLSQKRASAGISIEQHSNFRWLCILDGGAQKLGNYLWHDS